MMMPVITLISSSRWEFHVTWPLPPLVTLPTSSSGTRTSLEAPYTGQHSSFKLEVWPVSFPVWIFVLASHQLLTGEILHWAADSLSSFARPPPTQLCRSSRTSSWSSSLTSSFQSLSQDPTALKGCISFNIHSVAHHQLQDYHHNHWDLSLGKQFIITITALILIKR